MADFCNICYHDMFGDGEPDINVPRIFDDLDKGTGVVVGICEGCGLKAIAKDENGYFYVNYCGSGEFKMDDISRFHVPVNKRYHL